MELFREDSRSHWHSSGAVLLDVGVPAGHGHGDPEHTQRRADEHSENEENHLQLLMASLTAAASNRRTMTSRAPQAVNSSMAPIPIRTRVANSPVIRTCRRELTSHQNV